MSKRSSRPGRRVFLSGILALMGLAAAGLSVVWADLEEPSSRDERVARAVTVLIKKDHISRRALDDEISARCFKTFLDALDPDKLYFLQSDVDRFNQSRELLDDAIGDGNLDFAYDVFRTFLTRVDERTAVAHEMVDVEHDFTVDEQMAIDADDLPYPTNADEARERWRKRVKYHLLLLKLEELEGQEARDKLHARYRSFSKRMHQVSADELLEMYLTAMSTGFDPHTSYMSPQTLENFRIQMRLELEGIGAALRSEDGETIVAKIIPGGAASRQGELQAEDRIIGVGEGEEGEIVDTVDMKLTDVVNLIRGKKGSIVRLKAVHNDDPTPVVIAIERDKIELTDSEAQGEVFDAGQKADGSPYKIGVIKLPSFYMDMGAARLRRPDFKSTSRDVERILNGFKSEGVDAVLLDLRKNGGGALEEAIKVTGLFIDQGPVVQVKNADGRVEAYDDRDAGAVWEGPLVVMIDKFSASASEILAGAIQDYGRGLVIGDNHTHGKGTVQSLRDLGWEFMRDASQNFGALKITMQQFYRPNGDSTQNRGVVSDVELPSLSTYYDVGEEDLDYALEFDRVPAAEYNELGLVSLDVLNAVRGRSKDRIQRSEDFARRYEQIERYLSQKARKQVTLNEEKFMAQRAVFEEDRRRQRELDESGEPEDAIRRDFYMDEALDVTVDYLRLSSAAGIVLSANAAQAASR